MNARRQKERVDEAQTATVRAHYDRIARLYDRLEVRLETSTYAQWRKRVWTKVHGPRVLEIGVGTGKNLPYYPANVHVTAIDVSSQMLERARSRAAGMETAVDLRQMDAQRLAFPDNTFDTVIATFVLGSVPDPVLALREAARVTKRDGQILLLEYARPPGLLGTVADLLNPLVFLVYGANINRRTVANARRAGLTIEDVETFWKGLVQRIVARPEKGRLPVSEQGDGQTREHGVDETRRVRRIYDRNASRYDRAIRVMERLLLDDGRDWACTKARGDVLEIAVGTGRNLPYYPADIRLTGIDVSPLMLAHARQHARALGRDVDVRLGDAQALDFPGDTFDTVVCTLALCTIPDDQAALAEMQRVLRPGGRLLLLEHVRSPVLPVRAIQRLLDPLFVRLEGDHLLRDPLAHLQAPGFVVEQIVRTKWGLIERIVARKAMP